MGSKLDSMTEGAGPKPSTERFDIAHLTHDPSSSPSLLDYDIFARNQVLQALGVPFNYSCASRVVEAVFEYTGDM